MSKGNAAPNQKKLFVNVSGIILFQVGLGEVQNLSWFGIAGNFDTDVLLGM